MARSLLLLALVAATAAARGRHGGMVGGWSRIKNVRDAHIQELGGWAVAQARHEKLASDGLRFRRVTGGEEQLMGGTNYRLLVDATDGAGKRAPCVAVVYEVSWTNTRQLTSFERRRAN